MHSLLFSDEQQQIAEAVGGFLAKELPIDRFRPGVKNAPAEPTLWKDMAALGWFGIGVPEAQGGVGYGLMEEMILSREWGRYLVSPSVMASSLAIHLALAAGEKSSAEAIMAGESRVAPGTLTPPFSTNRNSPQSAYLYDSVDCDKVLLWTGNGLSLLDSSEIEKSEESLCLDDTLHLCDVEIALGNAVADSDDPLLNARATLMLSGQLAGIAQAATDLAVDYAKVREQFGRPIGSFQAVKHHCADMAVRSDALWSQVLFAAAAVDGGGAGAPLQVASAKLIAGSTAHKNAHSCIQIHGGIGFQAECDAHVFMKRGNFYDAMDGGAGQWAGRVLDGPLDW